MGGPRLLRAGAQSARLRPHRRGPARGEFPQAAAKLRDLPGIGDYTAAAVAAIAYDARTVPVDGNVERVVARLFAIGEALPRGKAVIRAAAERLAPDRRSGDFAQALMDLGATLCTPKNPACSRCPLRADCAAATRGDAEAFPVKETKRQGRLRRGAAFVLLRHDGCVLVRTRPANGLLGGMTEVPTSEWTHAFDEQTAFNHAPISPRSGEGNRPQFFFFKKKKKKLGGGGGRPDLLAAYPLHHAAHGSPPPFHGGGCTRIERTIAYRESHRFSPQ